MLGLKSFLPHEFICEIASEKFLREYRGFRIAYSFFPYALRKIHSMKNVSAIYCLPVLFHNITQKLMERIKLVTFGFVFGAFLMPKIKHSYKFDENIKNLQSIMIRRLGKKMPGKFICHRNIQELHKKIYKSLNVKYQIETAEEKLSGKSEILTENDENHCNCKIEVISAGADLIE